MTDYKHIIKFSKIFSLGLVLVFIVALVTSYFSKIGLVTGILRTSDYNRMYQGIHSIKGES